MNPKAHGLLDTQVVICISGNIGCLGRNVYLNLKLVYLLTAQFFGEDSQIAFRESDCILLEKQEK